MPEYVSDNPTLSSIWDPERNTETAAEVLAHRYQAAWWKCPKGHSFRRAPRMMLRDSSCPTCGVSSSSFAVEHTDLAKLWDLERNEGLQPTEIDARHPNECWWRCDSGHSFKRSPLQMAHDFACPHCVLAMESLGSLHPSLAAEWHPHRNGGVTPEHVNPDQIMVAWWRCSKGHEFQASVRSRVESGRRCPTCYGAWDIDRIRAFVKSLLANIDKLDPSEKIAVAMQAGVLRGRASQPFVLALANNRFPFSELEKFANGEPSEVDDFALSGQEQLAARKVAEEDDRFTLPDAPSSADDDDAVDIDVSKEVDLTSTAQAEDDLPVVETRDALAALEGALIASADAETVRFLRASANAKLWRHAYLRPEEARAQAAAFEGDTYSNMVRDQFLAEFDAADKLALPQGYSFRPTKTDPVTPPNLMQRHVAVSIKENRRYGNWSGMGAGKTLSAILATRLVGANLTVICCPNAVVDNWAKEVRNAFPSSEVVVKTWTPVWSDFAGGKPRYLVMNYEQFQQKDSSEQRLVEFIAENVVDFIVIDEIHFAKQREAGRASMSRRKRLVQGLVLESTKRNPDLCVLGMSGTPVINTLQEGKSLIELIRGQLYKDLDTTPTVQNCMKLYQHLVTLGTRWKPKYETQLDESNRPEIDCDPYLNEIREVGRATVLKLEQVLTKIRIPTIIEHLQPGEKALIYTHYVDGIANQLRDAVKKAGYRVGLFTGEEDDTDLKEFRDKDGLVDVLIASSRVSTGVDGLQHVCNKLIINSLPWTNAEYEQLKGRLWRQGSKFEKVEIIIPVTYAVVNGERWSYCESKLARLEYKKSIADAAVDGVVPEGNLRTPAQAQQDIMDWLARLEEGQLEEVVRPVIKIPLSGAPTEVSRRVAAYGDFSKMNNRWYAAKSGKTHARLAANPEEWGHYHTEYRRLREAWTVVPFQEEISWLSEREGGLVVGDFGCGEALIAKAVGDVHEVHSFDHVAIDDAVVACDMSSVPIKDGTLDVAIFCLSLMGSNFTDYIREAQRCLQLDGQIHIWEAANYFDDVEKFCAGLRKLGFNVVPPRKEGQFVAIVGYKNSKKPAPNLELTFRGKHGDEVTA